MMSGEVPTVTEGDSPQVTIVRDGGDRLRVLWFVNVPLPALARNLDEDTPLAGGWMESLRMKIVESGRIELAVAALTTRRLKPFVEDGTTYFTIPIDPPPRGVGAVVEGWRHRVEPPGALERCLDVVREHRPDIIHVHGSERFFGLVAEKTEIPVVVSIQGILTACLTHFFDGLSGSDVLRDCLTTGFVKGQRGRFVHDYLAMWRGARQERRILRVVTAVLGRTSWDREMSERLCPQAAYYEGPEVIRAAFHRCAWSPRSGDPVVTAVASGAPYKGLETLLESLALLRSGGHERAELRVVGSLAETAMWPVLDRRVRKLGLGDAVRWRGLLSPEDLVGELLAASVFVCSSHIENSPNSLAEAMLVGVPCVAAAVGGVPSVVTHGVDGLLFEDGAAAQLRDHIVALHADRTLSERISARARQSARRRHDGRRAARLTEEAYRSVVGGPPSG